MVTFIHRNALVMLACLLTTLGCHTFSGRPDATWSADLARADAIEVRTKTGTIRITDADAIERLATIHSNATWSTYWHTLPGDLGDRSIYLLSDGKELRHFTYTGVLWESNAYDDNRMATLGATDRDWLDSLFGLIPATQAGE